MDLSFEPLAMHVPSGWNFTEFTAASWSLNSFRSCREEKSQSLVVLSSEPDAMSLVSGEN